MCPGPVGICLKSVRFWSLCPKPGDTHFPDFSLMTGEVRHLISSFVPLGMSLMMSWLFTSFAQSP